MASQPFVGTMTDTSDQKEMDADEKLSEADLEAVFKKWEDQREGVAPSGLSFGDLPLTEEEVALDHELAQRPEAMVAKARTQVRLRLALMLALTVACAATLWFNRQDMAYWLTDSAPSDYGDLRQRWMAGERPGDGKWPELTSNSYVKFENLIMTEERESAGGSYYFFEPMTRMVVVTSRALPEKNPRANTVHSSFAELVNQRWLLVHDMTAGFSGQGRLIKESEAPRKYRKTARAYRDYLQLDSRLDGKDLWIFLDGVEPASQSIYLWIYAVAILVLLLSGYFYWKAHRKLQLLEDALTVSRVVRADSP